MSKNETLDSILAKYNRLCARYRDLEQQTTEKQEKWAELEAQFKTNESLTRELCELILAKDPEEMKLGAEYSWNKLQTRDIIQRSKTSFASYNEKRTELLRDIQRQSEERRMMIESLKMQIEQDENAKRELERLHSDDDDNESSPAKEAPDTSGEVDDRARSRMAYATQRVAERGDIDVVGFSVDDELLSGPSDARPGISDEDIRRGRKPVTASLKVWESDKDITAADVEQQADMAERAVLTSLERSGASITPSAKKAKTVAAQRKATEKQFMSVDISQISQKFTERHWTLIGVIGSTGMCEGTDITEAALAALKENGDTNVTDSGLRYILMNLSNSGVVDMDTTVKHPVKSKFATYSLSEIGRNLYATHFQKNAVTSERDIMIADHDNLEHAFGIKTLKQLLEASGSYTDVSMDRAANRRTLKDGTICIPDIVAQGKSRNKTFRAYMEYERGTHHQADYNIKLNKLSSLTRVVDIVCPNADTAETLKTKTASWVESRGGHAMLKNLKVRITSLRRLTGVTNINSDDNWIYVFNLNTSDNPIERK